MNRVSIIYVGNMSKLSKCLNSHKASNAQESYRRCGRVSAAGHCGAQARSLGLDTPANAPADGGWNWTQNRASTTGHREPAYRPLHREPAYRPIPRPRKPPGDVAHGPISTGPALAMLYGPIGPSYVPSNRKGRIPCQSRAVRRPKNAFFIGFSRRLNDYDHRPRTEGAIFPRFLGKDLF